MENYTFNYVAFLVRDAINKYAVTIKGYAERVSTWKNPNTCEFYYKKMNDCEDFIDLAIAYLAENNHPINKRLIERYEKYQDLRAQVVV